MTNTDATKQRTHAKKRNWRDGAYVRAPSPYARDREAGSTGMAAALLAKYRSLSSSGDSLVHSTVHGGGQSLLQQRRLPPASLVHVLPPELVAMLLAFLDGPSLLASAAVCRAMAALSHSRDVWRNICMKTWPTMKLQVLPQLPGAPDYDLIRLYGGSWRRCFVDQHGRNQRVAMQVKIPQFATAVDKVVSDTFALGDHRFCLWIFPHGNPNEPQYVGKVLSVYLVLTDLDRRPPDWQTCAVFSLAVVNHTHANKSIEWHSCLADNKFDSHLNNWGVHSLGALKTLRNPTSGFLQDGTLTVTANVRLMTITFRVVFATHLHTHTQLGLADFAHADTLELPFCCSLHDLLAKLEQVYGVNATTVKVWCFNQPVVSGQALRPRKRLTQQPNVDKTQPLFGNLLCDGVDIDAYSFCQLYVECPERDDPPLNVVEVADVAMAEANPVSPSLSTTSTASTTSSSATVAMDTTTTTEDVSDPHTPDTSYLFIKFMDPETLQLVYLGRFAYAKHNAYAATTALVYECVAQRLGCSSYELAMFKEEIAPTVFSGPIPWSDQPMAKCGFVYSLQPADIVVFTHTDTVNSGLFAEAMQNQLLVHYHAAESMLNHPSSYPTLEKIEILAERLDIPKFRVRSAFRKCHEDGRLTLKYIMEGRHLGFICDSCGETDFKGPRFNCSVCSDYDLCRHCHVKSHDVNHRYANVDGKWQRVYEFKDHTTNHTMREMLPVFYDYQPSTVSTTTTTSADVWMGDEAQHDGSHHLGMVVAHAW